ncbi:MAG: lysophospholipid acyltransferase family protein [Saprospiraceae bacterium]|nr:lysophospholipid acyltransferase family protein [Saprospiraceae bacterium]HMW37955.1 lysophospholipid acyltransferase family protein [Saprospiraceae bacterium]HMX87629.1 lysophospholipid acyltransferase family protein [Saprospiraceae bacterium]HMZ39444.1 lysophospholipid acyltransferase family protein [Saprospiraceae bacterium]HNA63660.1 lysophospholipid acyltransferase family protein [Saprospiraceae bacterium]
MLQFWLVRIVIISFTRISFAFLSPLSRLLSFFLHYFVRYRLAVIHRNLSKCITNLTAAEVNSLVGGVYDNLSFVLLEAIKGLTLSEAELLSRIEFRQPELITDYLDKKKSVLAVCPHYTNWEWTVLATGYTYKNKSIGIYKEIGNRYLEEYIKSLRAKCTMTLISTRHTRMMESLIPDGRVILLMSDQNPSNTRDAIWVKFFGQDTACLHGLEKYANRYHLPVIYLDQQRVTDSRYVVNLEVLCENPNELAPGELTQLFMSRVERTIRREPSNWLWSHKRWKHKKISD